MEKIVLEGNVNFKSEDSGAAKIAHIEGVSYDTPDNGMFVLIQSWDDRAWDKEDQKDAHPIVKELEGKRVKITIEVIG